MNERRPRIAVLVSAHPVDDMRVLHREATSMAEWADVTVFGLRGSTSPAGSTVELRVFDGGQGRVARILWAPWRIVRAAVQNGADFLHIHDPEILPAALLLGRMHGVRVVFDDHENYPEVMLSKTWLPRWLRRPMRRVMLIVYRYVAKTAALVITPTTSLAAEFEELGARAIVVRNFPPAGVFAVPGDLPSLVSRTHDVVHLGTVSELRLGTFAQIVEEVIRIRPTTTWLFVGLSDQSRRILTESLSDPARSVVTVRGIIPAEAVPEQLVQGRVGVNWHPDIPQFRTAIPNKVPEYLAMGMRVVSTAIPELESVLPESSSGEHGVTYASRDIPQFAQAVVDAVCGADAGTPPSPRETSQRVARLVSWEVEAETLREGYAEIMQLEV